MSHIMIQPPLSDTASEWRRYIKELWENPENIHRKALSKKVVDYYNYEQKPYLQKELQKIFTDPYSLASKRKWTHNYTKQLVDNVAQCYSCKIRRELPIRSKRQREIISDIIFHSLNSTMETANKWLVLERMNLLFSKWSQSHQRIIYKTFNQFQYDLLFNPDADEKELMAVILSDYRHLSDSNIWVYTLNKNYHFKGLDLVEEIEHGLNLLPFTVIYLEDPGFNDYLLPNEQIADSNLELNLANSNLLNMLQNKAHGVWVLKRPPEEPFAGIDDGDPNLSSPVRTERDRRVDIHDPSKILEITSGPNGEESSLEVVSPNTDFEGALKTIKFLADSLANSFGQESGIFETNASDNPATMFHINERKRQARIQVHQARFQDAEKDLFNKAYALAKLANPSLPALDPDKLTVEFVPEKLMVEQISMQDLLNALQAGVLDKIEVVRRLYPSLNREEAMEFMEKMEKDSESMEEEMEEEINN